jgi:hypothetical protein
MTATLTVSNGPARTLVPPVHKTRGLRHPGRFFRGSASNETGLARAWEQVRQNVNIVLMKHATSGPTRPLKLS